MSMAITEHNQSFNDDDMNVVTAQQFSLPVFYASRNVYVIKADCKERGRKQEYSKQSIK